jgi:hypothetical protein
LLQMELQPQTQLLQIPQLEELLLEELIILTQFLFPLFQPQKLKPPIPHTQQQPLLQQLLQVQLLQVQLQLLVLPPQVQQIMLIQHIQLLIQTQII